MKKIAAFFTAFAIFLVVIAVFHFSLSGDLKMNNKEFSTWYSPYKDLSCNAISQNMHKDTMLVFGSSEFRHGRKTPYHPVNIFKKQNIDLMLVGGPYNQSLNHAITLGAVGNSIQKKKVVLVVSPTWFYRKGVDKDKYALRFSEGNYIAFMQNEKIPLSVKKYVAQRSESLLSKNASMQSKVMLYDKVLVNSNNNPLLGLMYKVRSAYVRDKDIITVKGVLKTTKIRKNKYFNDKVRDPKPINWNLLSDQAAYSLKNMSHNRFLMSDHFWKKTFGKRLVSARGLHNDEDFKQSPEYDDLDCFLKVCKAENVKPMLLILPLNGRWYDYTGLTANKRATFVKKIEKYGKEYNAEVVDFSKYDYTPYMVSDAVHPWGKGWVKIDEKIYNFYNQI